ncbi:MAG: LLM class flavin-dependent oxidoreductase [SAR86 cluster bacterium]|uniref:Luciferase-like monooxygenase n=1 Tax=SAR86 cluster bacterium TaxID=2030880 RepID=A0A2A5B6J5_9GAMM|nr:MAG: LLM class flavin-dependent oxidoreductase [SAR86 cluster bacterium]
MNNKIKLSVLDQSPIRSGSNPYAALQETIKLAQLTDELGYYRYWVAEHHASDALAGCSPEVLLGRLGAETTQIRIGSGGVMLPHYSPYKVAENFKLLQTLYPGRVDLGVGRAPGTDPFTAAAIRYGSRVGPEHFPNMVADLQALLNDTDPSTKGMEQARAFPKVEIPPQLWMLGSSEDSAMLAGLSGLPYNFAYFINPNIQPGIFDLYRDHFKPGPNLKSPQGSLAIFSITAETEDEALNLSRSRDLWYTRLLRGNPGPFPSVKEAIEYPYSDGELQIIEENRDKRAVGTPEQVKEKLLMLAEKFQVDELMLVTITHDVAARRRSYELLAQIW